MNQNPAVTPQEEVQPKPAILLFHDSSDAMELELTFQKAVNAPTIPPTFEDVMEALRAKGVVYGVNEVALEAVCHNPIYDRTFAIAKGLEPKTGADGYLNYLIKTTRELKPKEREDGTVDYRDLGFIQQVSKDQPLCEIHEAQKGADGFDIYGNIREGRLGKAHFNPKGKNTYISEDGTMLLAECDGSAEVKRGVVEVIEVLRISGNVDNGTGDINFSGDVIVIGDVLSGFKIESGGSVTVKGSVEGATVRANEDIVVGEGINGMNRGSIVAGRNLKCKYIQSSYIKAGADIYADSIMYCNLECGGNAELNGKRATLIGGRASIAGRLTAKTIGTDSHVATQITMASSGVEKEQQLKALEQEIKDIDADLQKLIQLLTRYEDLIKQGRMNAEQAKAIVTVRDTYMSTAKRREELQQSLADAKREQLEASRENSYIECKDRLHVGVQITFGPLTMKINTSYVNSRIGIVNEDISITTL